MKAEAAFEAEKSTEYKIQSAENSVQKSFVEIMRIALA